MSAAAISQIIANFSNFEANNLFPREEDLDFEFERNFDSQIRKPYQQIRMEEKRK